MVAVEVASGLAVLHVVEGVVIDRGCAGFEALRILAGTGSATHDGACGGLQNRG